MSLASHSLIELLILIGIIFSIAALARMIKRFSRSMVFTVVLTTVAFAIFYFSPHQTIFSALVFSLRLFAVISSTSTFFLTTTPDELEHVMKWLHLPSDFVMVFVIAVRFIPVLMLDALQIMDAQRARGLEFDKGNFVQRIRNTIPVFVPLIAVALNRSLDLAEAMDSRAYGAYSKPTSLYTLKLRALDYLALVVICAGLFAGFYVAFFIHLL